MERFAIADVPEEAFMEMFPIGSDGETSTSSDEEREIYVFTCSTDRFLIPYDGTEQGFQLEFLFFWLPLDFVSENCLPSLSLPSPPPS